MKIAVQLYSVRNAYDKDYYETLKKVKEAGYEGVEFSGVGAIPAKELKKACQELGLVPVSAHVMYTDILNDMEGKFTYCKELGLKYIAIPWIDEKYRPGEAGFESLIEDVKKIGEEAKKYGIQLLYHNHDFEFKKYKGKYALDYLYENVDKELLGTEIDTAWVRLSSVDPGKYIEKYADRSYVVHLKDFAGKRKAADYTSISIEGEKKVEDIPFEFRPVGHGFQNFEKIMDSIYKTCAEWVVVEQDSPSMGLDELESVKKSIDYLKTIIK